MMMPGRNGYEIVAELRSEPGTKLMPIILLSARAGKVDELHARKVEPTTTSRSRSTRRSVKRVAELLQPGRDALRGGGPPGQAGAGPSRALVGPELSRS